MVNLDTKLELAQWLQGGAGEGRTLGGGTSTIKGTVVADSANGTVQVMVGEPDGSTTAADLTAELPIIGSATTGEEVTIIVQDGIPTAIAAPGWGDNIKADLQYMTFEPSGSYPGLHIHENASDYNVNGDLWLNSGAVDIRKNGTTVARFAELVLGLGVNSTLAAVQDADSTVEIDLLQEGKIDLTALSGSPVNPQDDIPLPTLYEYLRLSCATGADFDGNGVLFDGQTWTKGAAYIDGSVYASGLGYFGGDIEVDGQIKVWDGSDYVPISGGGLAPTSRTLATAGTTIPSRTTAYTAVDTTGWNWEEYADGTIHAWGKLHVTGVTMELSNSMRRANTTWYLPFPVALSQVDSLQMTNAGGSSLLLSSGFSDGTNSNYCEKWRPVEIGHFSSTASNQTFNLYVELLGRKA